MKFVSSAVPEIFGGPEISNVGHVTYSTPPYDIPYHQSACKI